MPTTSAARGAPGTGTVPRIAQNEPAWRPLQADLGRRKATIHLAAAADRTDGHVYTVDAMPEKTALASGNLDAAGLLHRVSILPMHKDQLIAVRLPE